MASGNSGSLQSSSGDEEYDSRAESISAFLNSSGTFASLSHHQQQPPPPAASHHNHHHSHPSSTSFDSLSNYFDAFPRSPPSNSSPLLNLDASWARNLRPPAPDQNCTDIPRLMGSSSSSLTNPMIPGPIGPVRGSYAGGGNISISPPSSSSLMHPSAPTDQPTSTTPRSSKKRSRASRRAPTTVLTTDTSNFRAMVQEFTGIPAPPFSSSSFPRSRFDLFHAAASTAMRSSGLADGMPPYLLRPFAQKVPVPSFGPFAASGASSSSMFDAIASTAAITSSNNANNPITSTGTNSTTISTTCTNTTSTNTDSSHNYQLPSDLGKNLLNMQNPLFNFQSILQSPPTPKYNSSNALPVFGAKSQMPPMNPMGADYAMSGIGQGQTNTTAQMGNLSNFLAPEGMSSRGGGSGGGVDHLSAWADSSESDGGNQVQLRSVSGNYSNSQRVNGCKMNYTASGSADFHAEKGSENVSARGEGMIDSWICSSD